ncbi:DUF2612 domain-containing protein [Paenibacillus sp. LMG 31456]|uniref:DUF2612 domain-containing protein n=1 Tax=Paenibacillus foliorum TaxID=2654974 RepID=A0A972GZ76_9BACL|nr:DUF2612 domain-containing protein [Paenibacillus foliorum]NOU95580.1 DUF2612 domain-containing protein [Paenibacillus foliorum]
MSIDDYLGLITSQHKVQPKFKAWLSSALSIVNDNFAMTVGIPSSFDIDTAVGNQLDVLGIIVGRNRTLNFQPAGGSSPVLDDENYRLALKAKIAQNQWDGTIPQVYEIWNSLFPDVNLIVIDNQDMTMSALVDGQLDPIATELVAARYIIPKPAGVEVTIIDVSNVFSTPYLGMVVSGIEFITVTTIVP